MPNYLSITVLIFISVYSIIYNAYLFKIGNYNPYLFKLTNNKRTNKEVVVNFILTLAAYWSLYNLFINLKLSFFTVGIALIVFLFCYTVYITVMNYFAYIKIRDRKIIYHTAIWCLLVIGFCSFMSLNIYRSDSNQVYQKHQLDQIEQIVLEQLTLEGNTQSNTNNYGLVAETKDSIFYIKENAVCRADKDFRNQLVIFDQDSDTGKDSINVVGDWAFFRQGKEIKRMKKDGSNVNRIFSGYSTQMHVVGNWVYFMNLSDDCKIYKMDVNGQKREILCNQVVRGMTVYDGKIYYSYESKEDGYLEVMNLDGTGKQLILNIKAINMVVDKEYIYYLNYVDNHLYRVKLIDNSIEQLSNKEIMKFCKDNDWIFYTLKAPKESNGRFKGLYRVDLDGSNGLTLDSESFLEEVGMGITKEWIFSVSSNGTNGSILSKLKKDGTSDLSWETN